MSVLIRVILAVLIGVLIVSLLDYLGVLTHPINVLLGIIGGLVFYFGYDR